MWADFSLPFWSSQSAKKKKKENKRKEKKQIPFYFLISPNIEYQHISRSAILGQGRIKDFGWGAETRRAGGASFTFRPIPVHKSLMNTAIHLAYGLFFHKLVNDEDIIIPLRGEKM